MMHTVSYILPGIMLILLCKSVHCIENDSIKKDTLILTCKQGIYITHEEFLADSPSIRSGFFIEQRSPLQQLVLFSTPNILRIYNEATGKYEKNKMECWGICDTNAFYIYSNKTCFMLDYKGRFSICSVNRWKWFVTTYFPLPFIIENKAIVDLDSNKKYAYTSSDMKELLSECDEDLFYDFKMESYKLQEIEKYLEKLNERKIMNESELIPD